MCVGFGERDGAHSGEPAGHQCVPAVPEEQLVRLLQDPQALVQEEDLHHQAAQRRRLHLQPRDHRVPDDLKASSSAVVHVTMRGGGVHFATYRSSLWNPF